jgi:hypothetical protein
VVETHIISTISKKLENIRDVLLDQGAKYICMYTIFIDKSSMLELDEAVRSMYKWYASASVELLYWTQEPHFKHGLNDVRWTEDKLQERKIQPRH